MSDALSLVITPAGIVRCVYAEHIDLRTLGHLKLARASHVEPDASGVWWADLGPVHGPRLGPFDCRSAALVAELRWLEDHWLAPCV